MYRNTSRMTTIIFTALLLFFAFTVLPAMALPPEVEADKLLISAGEKIDKKDYTEAGKDLEKIRGLNIKLPAEYSYQNGRYLAGTRQAVEAKKDLEAYLNKAGKEGKYYQEALKVYSEVEANEKSWSRFKSNGDGTVTDHKSGLMWAAKDNGADINWPNAKGYCQNYKAGGHADWRLPTQDELRGLYDQQEQGGHTPLIHMSGSYAWTSETRGSEAALYGFSIFSLGVQWLNQSTAGSDPYGTRALPVRSGK